MGGWGGGGGGVVGWWGWVRGGVEGVERGGGRSGPASLNLSKPL